jgi:hypothetical protein
MRVQHRLHRHRHQRARRIGQHRSPSLAEAEYFAVRLQIAERIGCVAPAPHIGDVHPRRSGECFRIRVAEAAQRLEQQIDHADIGDGEALRPLCHAAELLFRVGLVHVC